MLDAITSFLSGDGGLVSLAVSAFLSATLLPGSSEALLTAALASDPTLTRAFELAGIAALFNTLGSMTSWAIGRYFPKDPPSSEMLDRVRRRGAPALVLAWVPVIGDMIPLAAGWLKIGFWPALFWTAVGKSARYAVLSAALLGLL